MKIKLCLARTAYDASTFWTEIKTVDAEIPIDKQNHWQVIGAEWPEQRRFEGVRAPRSPGR